MKEEMMKDQNQEEILEKQDQLEEAQNTVQEEVTDAPEAIEADSETIPDRVEELDNQEISEDKSSQKEEGQDLITPEKMSTLAVDEVSDADIDAVEETEESVMPDSEKQTEEEELHSEPDYKVAKPANKKLIVALVVLVALIAGGLIGYNAYQKSIVQINAAYNASSEDDTKDGVVLDGANPNIIVEGTRRNGEIVTLEPGKWSIAEPATLEKDEKSTVTIAYKNLEVPLTVQCTASAITDLDIVYNGETVAGTVLDDSSEFDITIKYKNGKEEKAQEWHIKEPITLEIDSTGTVEIEVEQFSKEITIECSTSAIVDLDIAYKGDTKAGATINDDSKFDVTVKYKNGTEEKTDDWHIVKPATLKMDSSVKVTLEVGDFSKEVTIECSTSELLSIEAEYKGEATTGIVLDSANKGIQVSAQYKNGKKERVYTGYTIKEPKTLEPKETSTVEIEYEGKTCTLTVENQTKYFDLNYSEFKNQYNAKSGLGRIETGAYGTEVIKIGSSQLILFENDTDLYNNTHESGSITTGGSAKDGYFNELRIRWVTSDSEFTSENAAIVTVVGEDVAKIMDPDVSILEDMLQKGVVNNKNGKLIVDYSHNGFDYNLNCYDSTLSGLSQQFYYEFTISVSK